MDRLACFFLTARSIEDLEKRVLHAERLGYDTVGLPQIAARDAMTSLAAIAPKTSRIRLGTGIVPIWTRSPISLAQEASVLQEITDGRFILGIGVGHRILIESWHGTDFHKPLEAMRDYITILRSALRTGGADHQGSVFRSSFSFMGYQPSDVPILIAALGPKMAQLAGELADGVILWLSSPHHIREVVIPNLRIGAERAGRSIEEMEIFGCLFAAPGPDRVSSRNAIRQQLLTYMQLPFYRSVMEASGFDDDLRKFDEKMKEGLIPDALAALSDDLIDDIAATGSPDEIARTLEGFVEAGCTMPGVGAVGRYEGYQGAEWALETLSQAAALVG